MRERDTVWAVLAGKRRPAIVLEIMPDLIRVAYGTTNEVPEWAGATVHPGTRQGRRFPLTETTHFYGRNTAWAAPHELDRGEAPCSYELLFDVRSLVDQYDASVRDEEE